MEGHSEANNILISDLPNEILFKIFNDLDDGSLLSCRLVNQGWCAAASTILQSRPTVVVRLLFSPVSAGKKSPASFIECFNRSRKFRHPFIYVNFIVQGCNGKISDCPDIEPFFALTEHSNDRPGSGLQIKTLRFDVIRRYQTELNIMEKVIFERTPQLRILGVTFYGDINVRRLPLNTDTDPVSALCDDISTPVVKERQLLSLKVLQVGQRSGKAAVNFCHKILQAAPNIQTIEGLCPWTFQRGPYEVCKPEDFQLLIDTKKLHLVTQCEIMTNLRNLGSGILDREELSQFQPKSLYLCGPFADKELLSFGEEIKAGLRKVLWIVKDSMEELYTMNVLGALDKNSFPCFSKLKQLHLNSFIGSPILPPGIRDRSDVFPRLEKICLCPPRVSLENDMWSDLSHIPVVPSVNTVEILPYEAFTGRCLESMMLMCPNVWRLELSCTNSSHKYIMDFNQVGPLIWTNMTGIKTLSLYGISWKAIEVMDQFEAGFTGFSLETVRQYRAAAPEDRPKAEEVEHLRANLSILQMKKLENLILNFVDEKQASDFPLSFKYAFDLMPGLTVKILRQQTKRAR